MKKRIKWIVGVGVLAAAPFVTAAPASAGVGGCTTAMLGVPVEDAPLFYVDCNFNLVGWCLTNYDPIDTPVTVNQITGETIAYAACMAL